ncbi:MAG: type II toxin-antitoxin system VapC family toxin [Thermodesulfobacteriota bacterium]
MYILDTNTIIYFFKGIGNVSQQFLKQSPKAISIPSIVLYELYVGIGKSQTPLKLIKQIEELISIVSIVTFTDKEAKFSASIRVELEREGNSIGPIDILIAGTALANNSILVTHNINEFQRIPKLQLEDWY